MPFAYPGKTSIVRAIRRWLHHDGVRPASQRALVIRLHAQGLNASQIARRTGIPRSTIREWLRAPSRSRIRPAWTPAELPGDAYAYLLGAYLGDGHVVRHARGTYRLVVTNDARYPSISLEIAEAIARVVPRSRVSISAHPVHRCVRIGAYSRHWPALLPQHGPGRKHHRKIRLESWQRTITHTHAACFVRGLVHTDGSRFIARQPAGGKTYTYVRYAFANRSEDIKELFCEHLDLLGVSWTRPNDKDIQVATRSSVEILERLVGPKA